ncbi:MAG: ABC transporter permease subunit [Christensenellales bacterium]
MEAFETLIERIAPNLYAYRDRFFTSFAATFEMFGKAGLIAFVVGLFFGVLLVVTRKGGVRENLLVYQVVNIVINVFRSIPFIILLIFLIPLTRAVVGSAIGVKGAILPLVFGTVPFYTRQVEVALAGVNEGKVEAARSMGSGTLGLIFRVVSARSRAGADSCDDGDGHQPHRPDDDGRCGRRGRHRQLCHQLRPKPEPSGYRQRLRGGAADRRVHFAEPGQCAGAAHDE